MYEFQESESYMESYRATDLIKCSLQCLNIEKNKYLSRDKFFFFVKISEKVTYIYNTVL